MDERRLAELFRDAADTAGHNAPPPTFDHADVLAGSARARQRHQRRLTGGIAVAVVVLAAAGIGSATVLSSGGSNSTLAEPAQSSASDQAPAPYAAAPGAQPAVPPAGGAPEASPFSSQKRDASSTCATPDAELFAELTEVLPAVRGASPRPLSDQVGCPSNGRGFEVDVNDGGARGVMRVVLAPSGGGMSVQSRGGGSVVTTSRNTPRGSSLSVSIVSDGRAPYTSQLSRIARALADRH